MKTLYDVLDVRSDDDAESVREAFRKAVKANHPDLNAGDPDAQSRFAQIARANAILRDPELRVIYDRMLEFEGQQSRPQSKLVAIFNTTHSIATDTITAFVLAFVLAGGGYKLFTYLSATSNVTARESVTVAAAAPSPPRPFIAGKPHDELEGADAVVPNAQAPTANAAVPPLAAMDADGQPKVIGSPNSAAATMDDVIRRANSRLGVHATAIAADVKAAVDAAPGPAKTTAAPPPPPPFIAGEPHEQREGADVVVSNAQAPTANAAVPPLVPVEAAGHLKAVGVPKSSATALGAAVDVTADVNTAMDAAPGRAEATAAPPPPRPFIAGEPHDELEGADTVVPNAQAPTENSDVAEASPFNELIPASRSKDARFYRERGVALYRSGDFSLAIAYFDQAIRLDPNSEAAYVDRGIALYRMGEFGRAFADIVRAKRTNSHQAVTLPSKPRKGAAAVK